ncbi:P27 family phage terminase small subunit [Vibrio cholerae]|uniref:P27 family phage terminase small subunit n=1 Tax=Vibrio cholerae TaxID=666 RepID=UPI003530A9ED
MAKITAISSLENAPKTMEKHQIITGFYKELLQACEHIKTVTESDRIAAMMIAEQYFIYRHAFLSLFDQETGQPMVTYERIGDNGEPIIKPNPAIKVVDDTNKRIMAGLEQMGLTPKARKQVEKLEAEKESALLKFLKGD